MKFKYVLLVWLFRWKYTNIILILLILILKHYCVLPPQVRKGAIGAKCGLVFAYNDSEPFDADKHFKRFKKFDSWDYKDYKEFVQDRYATFLVCNMLIYLSGVHLHYIVAHKRQLNAEHMNFKWCLLWSV